MPGIELELYNMLCIPHSYLQLTCSSRWFSSFSWVRLHWARIVLSFRLLGTCRICSSGTSSCFRDWFRTCRHIVEEFNVVSKGQLYNHKPKLQVFESFVSSVNQNLSKSRRRVIFRIKNLNQGSKSFQSGPERWSDSLHSALISLLGFWALTGSISDTKREGCP